MNLQKRGGGHNNSKVVPEELQNFQLKFKKLARRVSRPIEILLIALAVKKTAGKSKPKKS